MQTWLADIATEQRVTLEFLGYSERNSFNSSTDQEDQDESFESDLNENLNLT